MVPPRRSRERCMAILVAVPIGDQVADALIAKLVPKIQALKMGHPDRTWRCSRRWTRSG